MSLLWEVAPGTGLPTWFSQRHMLQRLEEEVARCRRQANGGQLAVVLGEVLPQTEESISADQASQLASWVARQIGETKRRCDVAGQYGLHGFMLLLPQATAGEALGACRRLGDVLAHPPHEGLSKVHACFGLAGVPQDVASVPALLSRAEQRLERARETGSNIVIE
jgi:diguanylate cyclase (GGDEF)-like protein